ncbi:MAG: hypothetical protein HN348_31935 [Proteobacteria bacterium]|jgi:acyl dehydratase|nr:hypothetical protein [Pseudomonadota bacterium]
MSVAARHVLSQGPVVGALLRTGWVAFRSRSEGTPDTMTTPGPVFEGTVGPRPPRLVKDYIRHCGGSPSWYKGVVPAHLFPQWGFPMFSKTLEGIPYDLTKVLNGGCRIEINHPIPLGEKLRLKACLVDIDDNGSRAVLKQRLITSTETVDEAIVSYLYAIVPLKKKGDKKKSGKKEKPRVNQDYREIGLWKLHKKAGWEFAVLTGDFNPVHWVPPYAQAAGFKNCILHGFSTLGRSIENLNRVVWSGDASRLKTIDVKFTKPLVLPTKVGLFVDDQGGFAVGHNPGGPAYLTGEYTTREDA